MILVTGGAGYIGSHCVLALINAGYEVVVLDNLETGHAETINTIKSIGSIGFQNGDLRNLEDVTQVFEKGKIDAVMHLAAFSQVEESVRDPQKYYYNNVCGTVNLLNAMMKNGVNKIVFSSTASVYGEPIYTPIDEKHPLSPVNPYGKSKVIVENLMDDYDRAYGLKSVRFRYFNVAGADSLARIGEWHDPETHLIPRILKSALGAFQSFELYGADYSTKDGTCIRDYINIEDLADAHALGLKYLLAGGKTDYFNLGTNDGNSVMEIFAECAKVVGKALPINTKLRRAGDVVILVADNKKAQNILGWSPKKTLRQSIESAYKWEQAFQKRTVYA
jgi:UDP-glucose 4-epimerase